ncbi:hypothetical protein [Eubacterium sp. F2]|jgi:hypothetical protein|uniref:hypothetical protein n=1 Tax=Eubacterium sp. F2 TaxID=3381348 RepID=UPI0039083391
MKIAKRGILLALMCVLCISMLTGCGNKLVNQKEDSVKKLLKKPISSTESEGWKYKSLKITKTNKDKDTIEVKVRYSRKSDITKYIVANCTVKPADNFMFRTVKSMNLEEKYKLSDYDKDKSKAKNKLLSKSYSIGNKSIDSWITAENKKWKKPGDKMSVKTKNGSFDIIFGLGRKTDWDDELTDSYMAAIQATLTSHKYKDPLYDEGVCYYDLLTNKDVTIMTEDGVACSAGDDSGPTYGPYDPDATVAEGDTARIAFETIVPNDKSKVIIRVGNKYYVPMKLDQNVLSW